MSWNSEFKSYNTNSTVNTVVTLPSFAPKEAGSNKSWESQSLSVALFFVGGYSLWVSWLNKRSC